MDIYNQIISLLEKEFHLSEGTQYIPDEKKSILKKASELLEVCWEEQYLENIELIAGSGSNSLKVSLISEDLVGDNGRDNPLCQLAVLADMLLFCSKGGGLLGMNLLFNGIIENR